LEGNVVRCEATTGVLFAFVADRLKGHFALWNDYPDQKITEVSVETYLPT
jgi:hypothetical protein